MHTQKEKQFSKTGKKRPQQQQQQEADMEQRFSAYKKKILKTSKNLQGSKTQVFVQKSVEFDFESVNLEDISDTPRQVIVKKKDFPIDMVSIITKAELIDFKKDKGERKELVLDIFFVHDLQENKFDREIRGEIINYSDVSIRFHLPKRFQDRFEGCDPAQLVGSFLMAPQHDRKKWQNEKDRDKSSIPLIMFLKNRRSIEKLGILLEECPPVAEFQLESKLSLNEDYEPNQIMGLIFDYFRNQTNYFYARETHKTNTV